MTAGAWMQPELALPDDAEGRLRQIRGGEWDEALMWVRGIQVYVTATVIQGGGLVKLECRDRPPIEAVDPMKVNSVEQFR